MVEVKIVEDKIVEIKIVEVNLLVDETFSSTNCR